MLARRTTVLLLALVVSAGRSAVVRIQEKVEVSAPILTLADISEILANDPAESARIGKTELGPSPEAGGSYWLDLADVKDRLYRRGIRLDQVEFAGARRVEVVRSTSSPVRGGGTRTAKDWKLEMARLVLEAAQADLGDDEKDLRVRVEAERAADFLAEHPTSDWEILAPPQWVEGWQELELAVRTGEDSPRFPMRAQLWRVSPIVAASRDIRRGEKISRADIQLVSHEAADDVSGLVDRPEDVVGMEAKRDLAAGRPIAARDIRSSPVVFRGQPVTVRIAYRTAWVQKTFLAATDAGKGEWIEIHDPERRDGRAHDYLVRVTGPHAAELPENAPLNPIAARVKKTNTARPSTQTKERTRP